METIIHLHLSELMGSTQKISESLRILSGNTDPEITLTVNSIDGKRVQYFKDLDTSLDQMKNGDFVSFTMAELETYIHKLTE